MSDNDRDMDVESDDEQDSNTRQLSAPSPNPLVQQRSLAEKKAHHNALERKRRDILKDTFKSLLNALPISRGEKVSRAGTLKKALEYIKSKEEKTTFYQMCIDEMKSDISKFEAELEQLETLQAIKILTELKNGPSPRFDVGDGYPGDKRSCNENDTEMQDNISN